MKKLTETTQIKPKRIIKPLKKLSPRHIVAQELLEKSQIPITTIAKALNYNRCYVNELKKKLEKTSLVSLQRVKLAHRTISDKMKMKPVEMEKVLKDGTVVKYMDYPPHAVALDAAKTIAHQHEPVIQRHQNENVNLDATVMDYSRFKLR